MKPETDNTADFHYMLLANEIERKAVDGVYNIGDKLPSLRKLHSELGLSVSTVMQAYIELEKRGIVEARPKSGYYIRGIPQVRLATPTLKRHASTPRRPSPASLIYEIINAKNDPNLLSLGATLLAPELLPLKQFSQHLKRLARERIDELATYGDPAGHGLLRQELCKRVLGNSDRIGSDDIVITNGCQEAIALCLRAVAGPGDIIAIESPSFFCFFPLIRDLGMYALEIPTHPDTGIDLDYLHAATRQNRIKACLLIPNIHNPLGFIMPEENKARLVAMMSTLNIPIIEDGIYSDLYFTGKRPPPIKAYDRDGLVMYCSSFSKTLAPGLRIGWTLPGRYKEAVERLKLGSSIAASHLSQVLAADFLRSGSMDRYLRQLRGKLRIQMNNTALAIARHFPDDIKVTAPKGGYVLWVELPKGADSMDVYRTALRQNIGICPGALFSSGPHFNRYIRISCGVRWDDGVEQGIARLGKVIKHML